MENSTTLPIPAQDVKPKYIPTVFIIYGATGDLMTKKIAPALFNLYKKGKFPKLFKIIGFSRRTLSEDAFRRHVRDILLRHNSHLATSEDIDEFLNYFLFQQGDFEKIDSYKVLAERMGIIDGQWQVCSNKLFYLAVPPEYYASISQHLADSGLTIPCGPDEGWTRVIVEKPFGKDLSTAESLDKLLAKLFKEEQIYRIDHYLAKEMLQNILTFRFANSLFESQWSNKTIERIDIKLHESLSVTGRGPFYDGLGALRDVGQNHLLQMLALITMERPESFESKDIRPRRAQILKTLKIPSEEEIIKSTFRAQYKGYKDVAGVNPNSTTETYFRVKAELTSPRWKGIPVFLESGKRIPVRKEIVVTFRHPNPCLCPPTGHVKNKVIFSLEPREGIRIEFLSKRPGLEFRTDKRHFNFLYRRATERMQYVEEYEKLLMDCIAGNQLLFLSTPEIEAMWKFIDPISKAWEENKVPLKEYKQGNSKVVIDSRTTYEYNGSK